MPNLSELQTMMGDALRQHQSSHSALLPLLLARGVGAAEAVQVSRNNFVGTLVNALHVSFPVVSRLVGRDFFDTAAAAFVRSAPPRSPWLDSYGAGFPAFLTKYATLAALPYIAEVAELEWLINLALHACKGDACDIAALGALDDDAAGRVRLHPAPSFGLLRVVHPVDAIWSAVLGLNACDDDGEHGDTRLAAIDLQSGPVWLCVSRQAHGVDVRRMSEEAWRFAAALRDGVALATATSCVDGDVGALLAAHLQQHHFTSFSISA